MSILKTTRTKALEIAFLEEGPATGWLPRGRVRGRDLLLGDLFPFVDSLGHKAIFSVK